MISTLLALTTALFTIQDTSSDWPQFGGPARLNTSPLTGVSFDWPAEGPQVVWRVDVGIGFGGVAVRDGDVVLLDREVGEADRLRVMDLESGKEKWSASYAAPGRLNYPGSRTVPTITEKFIYTSGGLGRVTCFDRATHAEVWGVKLDEVFDGRMPNFGWAASPLVVGDIVVAAPMGAAVGLVGLNRFTGEEVWSTAPVDRSHSTPVLLHLLGIPQVVFLSPVKLLPDGNQAERGTMRVTSLDPASGMLLWETSVALCRAPIPGALQIDNDRFFLTGGYEGGSSMMRLLKKGAGFEVEQLFHIDRGSQLHTPIRVGEHLYFMANENWNNKRNKQAEGGLTCLTLDGREAWRTRDDPYFGRGSMVLIDGHLVIQDGFNGSLRVARATPDGYEQVSEASLFGFDDNRDHQTWAPMAVAGGFLLLRSQEELVCVKL